ncbi:phosphatidylinositol N-acetylglucosaminyltransferase subunit C [Naematelia encephala]|uniref:Phosphatidylinositol N-acetylglucosaminyltransferase subunit C n=1 Tax=Naematelia encephala TaxID=71784 RepID=A0A1Y2AS10_9TREE|nr:phosphatidylinositol N-acetylglucosaminyltransferase subunit C [Naematelia encephala]
MSSKKASKRRQVTHTESSNPTEEAPGPAVEWEKALWKRQPFEDNYVPSTFLHDLQHLPSRPRPSLNTLFFSALPISQHLAVIALFIAIFYALLEGSLDAAEVGWTCVVLGIAGYVLRRWGWRDSLPDDSSLNQTDKGILPPPTAIRPLLLPPLLLSLLAPVLGTLTSATTSDTIWPLAGGLFFVHLLLADFTTGKDARRRRRELRRREETRRRNSVSSLHVEVEIVEEKSLTSSLSLTSALSASIVLASRLKSTSQVFSLVLLSVALFAGWPILAKGVRESGRIFSLALTSSMIILAISLFPRISSNPPSPSDPTPWISIPTPSGPTLIFLVAVILVNGIGPGMLWYGWRWKMRRGGGWDVAVVRLRRVRDRGG